MANGFGVDQRILGGVGGLNPTLEGMAPIRDALDENEFPMVQYSPVGRLRLIRALRRKFGPNFRSVPQAESAMKFFDDTMEFNMNIVGGQNG